mmetsp:Transcript_73305/g.177311  ORF Transcript_73305/g.177311 Transcript_73305/m.177311 type:complete len:293 (+) Transcript_73305:81-959(+)
MAPLSEALLSGESARQPRPVVRAAALSAALLAAAGLFYAGAEFGRTTPHNSAAYGVSLKALNVSLPRNLKGATSLAMGLNADCYTYTGGTCLVDDCNPQRNAECVDKKCMCTTGCTGADGTCYQGTYPILAAGFTLTNKEYTWQKLYFPALAPLDQLKTSAMASFFMLGKDKFILHQLPGTVAGKKDYFLTCQRFPDYVAAIRATAGTAFSLFGAYEVGLAWEFAPDRLAVQVCSKGDGQIMIGSPGAMATEWFYIHHGSWNVYGDSSREPGDGAVWVSDPPIPDGMLPVCV